MKNLLNFASIATISLMTIGLGACQVRTSLPFATAKVGPGGSSAPIEEVATTGGIDEPSTSCSQELGRDAGGKVRSAHELNGKKVRGCLVEGDRYDTYLVHVPEGHETLPYRIKVISQTDTIGAQLLTLDDERITGDNVIGDGEAFRKTVHLDSGETYKLVIKNFHNHQNVRYIVDVRPNTTIAEN